MKKQLYIILKISFLLITTPVLSQNVNGVVVYKLIDSPYLKPDKDDKPKKDIDETQKRVDRLFEMSIEKMKELRWELIFSNGKAIFRTVPMMEISEEEERYISFAETLVSVYKSYYTDTNKKELIVERNFDYEDYLVVNPIDISKWKLTSNTKKIGKYLCYEATLEEEFTTYKGEQKTRTQRAWYTPQIPVLFGPKDFSGFPGLVLEITDKGTTFTATEIILSKKEPLSIEPPTKGKRITEKEMSKILKEYRENNMIIIKNIRKRNKKRK